MDFELTLLLYLTDLEWFKLIYNWKPNHAHSNTDKEQESFIGANLHDLCTYEPLGSQAEAPSNLYYGT